MPAVPYIIVEGDPVNGSYSALLSKLSLLPPEIFNEFVLDGFKIKLMDQDVKSEAYSGQAAPAEEVRACFDYEKKTMWVRDLYVSETLHEMGHFVNDKLGMVSESAQCYQLYLTEAHKVSSYAETNSREYFAESFKMYLEHPAVLFRLSPATYHMIQMSIEQFEIKRQQGGL